MRRSKSVVIDHQVGQCFVREVRPGGNSHQAPPVVFVHGGFHGSWAWEKWQPYLAEGGWRSFAISLPGHTGSPLPDDEYVTRSLTDYASSVGQLLDWIGEPVGLIGHSLGGVVAQLVAQTHGLDCLVLIGSGRFRATDDGGPDFPPESLVIMTAAEARTRFFHRIEEDDFQAIAERLCPESPVALNGRTRGGVIESPSFDCPVLVMVAEHDSALVYDVAAYAVQSYHATQWVATGAGHDLMLEPTWKDSANALIAWLTQHLPQPSVVVQASR